MQTSRVVMSIYSWIYAVDSNTLVDVLERVIASRDTAVLVSFIVLGLVVVYVEVSGCNVLLFMNLHYRQ